MKKREIKYQEKTDLRRNSKLNEDFISFSEIDIKDKHPSPEKPQLEGPERNAMMEKLECSSSNNNDPGNFFYAKNFSRWLSENTLRIKDIFLFFHNEILDFCQYIEENEKEKATRREVVDRIKKVVLKCYPKAKVLVFGSCASGLNLPNSDIDLLVYNPEVRENSMINKLASELVSAHICKSIDPIKHAKVPIIKL